MTPTLLPWSALAAFTVAGATMMMAIRALRRRRRWRAVLGLGHGLLWVLGGVFLLGLTAQFHVYRQLTAERPVATLQTAQLAPRLYRIILDDGKHIRILRIHGDQWRLDAQVLVWQGPLRALGLPPLYRLERLSGRYRDPRLERHAPRSVHDLRPREPLPSWLTLSLDRLPGVDSRYGSSAYMDLEDDARYLVTLSPTGLVARRLPAPAP